MQSNLQNHLFAAENTVRKKAIVPLKAPMVYGSSAFMENTERAKRQEDRERTVTVLMDERPSFCADSAKELVCAIMEMGYLVQSVTVAEFCAKTVSELGFLVVLPHAESVPAVCARLLEQFWSQGGRVLVLGGRLFAHLIERGPNGFAKMPLEVEDVDAASSGKMHPIMLEGVTPPHKVFETGDISRFMTEQDQVMVRGTLNTNTKEEIVCPQARTHGFGYNAEHRNRYVPLIQAMGEGGRAGGRRGAAAFLMLTDIRAHNDGYTDRNRLGLVVSTNRGACLAGIGLKRQDVLRVEGMRTVLEELLAVMYRGLYLYEAGSDHFFVEPGQPIRIGARVMNQNYDFLTVRVEFRVHKDGQLVLNGTQEVLANAMDLTAVEQEFTAQSCGEYTVETLLQADNMVIDRIAHTFTVAQTQTPTPDAFVQVQGDEFVLNGKPWRAFGINYWPLYCPGIENVEYWMGWQDKANYDPLEVEYDLTMLEEIGINALCLRFDGDLLNRCVDPIRDFVRRCGRHGMRLMMSCCSLTAPMYYQDAAFRTFLAKTKLHLNPTVFAFDLGWETNEKFYGQVYRNILDADWAKWIEERYGSVENAEKDWQTAVDRTAYGQITSPPIEEFSADGAWHVKICAYRRFLYDYMSRTWNNAATRVRQAAPYQLVTCRTGPVMRNTTAIDGGIKHLDFISPEGWRMPGDTCGEYHALTVPLLIAMTTRGKPIVWAEYGLSTTDMGWRKFEWDIENVRPLQRKVAEQEQWLTHFFCAHKRAHINGTAPWWFPGGLRRSEKSDCGFCEPNGTLRPCAQRYAELGEWFRNPLPKPKADRTVLVDKDAYATGWAHYIYGDIKPGDENKPLDGNYNRMVNEVRGEGCIAVAEAEKRGETIAFCTTGTGTTSADMPRLAVGNVPMNGTNPPKYLDAEFNCVQVKTEDGTVMCISNGAHVQAKRVWVRANVGNLQEAMWLKPNGNATGGVHMQVSGQASARGAILADTAYLTDVNTEWVELSEHGAYTLRMTAEGQGAFGEVWRIFLEA